VWTGPSAVGFPGAPEPDLSAGMRVGVGHVGGAHGRDRAGRVGWWDRPDRPFDGARQPPNSGTVMTLGVDSRPSAGLDRIPRSARARVAVTQYEKHVRRDHVPPWGAGEVE